MPPFKRMKTNYWGVFYIEGTSPTNGKPEKIFYIRYRKGGKMIEEKAGRQTQDDMTPAGPPASALNGCKESDHLARRPGRKRKRPEKQRPHAGLRSSMAGVQRPETRLQGFEGRPWPV